jgi:hypothetical protein
VSPACTGGWTFPSSRLFTALSPDAPVISISDAQRGPLPWANWQATVHHGLPEDSLAFWANQDSIWHSSVALQRKKAWTGPFSAKRVGMPLKIAAKIDRADQQYFEAVIKPLLTEPLVECIGEIGYLEKMHFAVTLLPCYSRSTGRNPLAS